MLGLHEVLGTRENNVSSYGDNGVVRIILSTSNDTRLPSSRACFCRGKAIRLPNPP